jgi:xanthine dehydrogenase YagT iron-sulfur-binding subunit
MSRKKRDADFSRRGFLQGIGAAMGGAAVGLPRRPVQAAPKVLGPGPVPVTLTVNGASRTLSVEPRVTLLAALREQLDVTGPKDVCDRGACGACSVLLDGKLVNACMVLAVDADGRTVTTAEGLGRNGALHPVQKAFCEHDGLQCGFCTPGMVVAASALLDRSDAPTRADIRDGLAGNLCRCGTYPRIFEAVEAAAKGRGK